MDASNDHFGFCYQAWEKGEFGKPTLASSDQYFTNCSSTTMMISVPEHAVPTVIGPPLARKWSCSCMVRVSLGENACETKDGVSGSTEERLRDKGGPSEGLLRPPGLLGPPQPSWSPVKA